MTDTPSYVRRVYSDFIMKKSDVDRFRMGFEMADVGQRMVKNHFRQTYPDWSKGTIKAAVFERIYRNDYSVEEMERIRNAIIAFHQL